MKLKNFRDLMKKMLTKKEIEEVEMEAAIDFSKFNSSTPCGKCDKRIWGNTPSGLIGVTLKGDVAYPVCIRCQEK
jgi:hypothetical protein